MPIGVYQEGDGFVVRMSYMGSAWSLDHRYKSMKYAANAFKRYREKFIKDIAERRKGVISSKIYDGLKKWIVDPKHVPLNGTK